MSFTEITDITNDLYNPLHVYDMHILSGTCNIMSYSYNNRITIFPNDSLATLKSRFFGYKGTITGNTYELSSPVSRKVCLYDRDTGELVDFKHSIDNDGSFIFYVFDNKKYFIVGLDDDAGVDYDDILISKITPTDY